MKVKIIVIATVVSAAALGVVGLYAKSKLQGSKVRLYYSIDVDAAVADRVATIAADLQDEADTNNEAIKVALVKTGVIVATAAEGTDLDAFRKRVSERYKDTLSLKKAGASRLEVRLKKDHESKLRTYMLRSVTHTARQRLIAFFGNNADIGLYRDRGNMLRVELPPLDAKKLAEFKSRIAAQGNLEFRMADDVAPLTTRAAKKLKGNPKVTLKTDEYDGLKRGKIKFAFLASQDRDALVRFLGGLKGDLAPPPNREFLLGETWNYDAQKPQHMTYYLHRKPLLSGKHIGSAKVEWDERTSRPEVALTFTAQGAKLFESVTGKYIGHRLAIILNGQVNSAPVIQAPIKGGRARITLGEFKSPVALQQEANDLVAVLQAGTLPARISLVKTENR